MFFTKTLIALFGVATVAMANPVSRQVGPTTKCFFIMTPTPDLGPDGLQTDINFAIGHTLGVNFPNTPLQDDNEPLVRHNDGTYDVTSVISVEGQSAEDVGAFVESWAGTTIDGIDAEWAVGAANCV
ncbi:hypothetical protein D9758_005294 [Tetrapyrgos nigripes]|uniref:Uncharacterized protein n=1 Tax=Tetrapyrgos nigripes TaxID=182062 RepID=A0A8H5GX28_9AGAR|nr:hypothetical protein D9758_005294 [Tetrapyrgos nigripes]